MVLALTHSVVKWLLVRHCAIVNCADVVSFATGASFVHHFVTQARDSLLDLEDADFAAVDAEAAALDVPATVDALIADCTLAAWVLYHVLFFGYWLCLSSHATQGSQRLKPRRTNAELIDWTGEWTELNSSSSSDPALWGKGDVVFTYPPGSAPAPAEPEGGVAAMDLPPPGRPASRSTRSTQPGQLFSLEV